MADTSYDALLDRWRPQTSIDAQSGWPLVHCGVPDAGIVWDRVIDDAREERHRQLIGDAFSPRNDESGP